ncbi:response regulator (plasmid) [Haloferax larsenii]|uniref:Response regulator n=1 Tax=Haloferax larsenii TaxID=302484 RepID=A0ABY5RMV4_HALLR|nr:response regulator [Haloferax larsenii]UVE52520.1 response regulator [Haloferax larsenii]
MEHGTRESPSIRVLYVDDDDGLLTLTKRFLESQRDRLEIETTQSPKRALQMLDEREFDVLVSDFQMPELSGLELLETVRRERGSSIPVVIFTGRSREEVAIEALNLGADRYIQKGGDPSTQYGVLLQTIEQLASHRQARQRLRKREAHLEITLDSIAEAVVATDASGEIQKMNRTAEELTGWNTADAVGKHLRDVFHFVDDETGDPLTPSAEVLEHGSSVELEDTTKLVVDGGETRYIDGSVSPILTDDGTIEGLVAVLRDVTDDVLERERRERQQDALIEMATSDAVLMGSFDEAVRHITETVAETLDIDRASIWLADESGTTLFCEDRYDRRDETHTAGDQISADDYPAYFEALESNRSISVVDARTNPLTSELRDDYLAPNAVTSMLDATLRSGGTIAGVVCTEHVGDPRDWRADEITFAAEVADTVVITLLQASGVDRRDKNSTVDREPLTDES